MSKKISVFFLALVFVAIACVEPYNLELFDNSSKIIFVNGFLTNENIDQEITIAESTPLSGIVYNEEIPNLMVEIIVDGYEKIQLLHQGRGIYLIPSSLKFLKNKKYKLHFVRPDGREYESTEQIFQEAPKINKVYDEFSINGIDKKGKKGPGHKIYIDYQDPVNEQNNYYWTWQLWERQFYCLTSGNFDYFCNSDCYEIVYNLDVNISSDIFSNGKSITSKLIAELPYYQDRGALVEIKQLSVSNEALKYLQIYKNQTQSTGTLADTPPAKLVGNIKNIQDNTEEVAGFFTISGATTIKYWLSRENAIGKVRPVGLLDHTPNTSPFASRVPCEISRYRTPFRPLGWKD
jgi:Domain of unknown function (DUF4249)